MKAYQSIRDAAFATLNARRSKRLDTSTMAAPIELRLLALLCGLMLVAAVAVYQRLDGENLAPAAQKSVPVLNADVLPVVPPELWRKLNVSAEAPDVIHALSNSGINFQWHENLPVAMIDGADFKHRMPRAIWLKLEQPGNAYAVLETDAGTFVKPLDDATPGAASRCVTDRYFGTLDGEPAYLEDRDNVRVSRLWIVQDTSVNPKQAPGYIALLPNEEVLSGVLLAKIK